MHLIFLLFSVSSARFSMHKHCYWQPVLIVVIHPCPPDVLPVTKQTCTTPQVVFFSFLVCPPSLLSCLHSYCSSAIITKALLPIPQTQRRHCRYFHDLTTFLFCSFCGKICLSFTKTLTVHVEQVLMSKGEKFVVFQEDVEIQLLFWPNSELSKTINVTKHE